MLFVRVHPELVAFQMPHGAETVNPINKLMKATGISLFDITVSTLRMFRLFSQGLVVGRFFECNPFGVAQQDLGATGIGRITHPADAHLRLTSSVSRFSSSGVGMFPAETPGSLVHARVMTSALLTI
jgi:hypothetical protein